MRDGGGGGDQSVTASAGSRLRRSRERGKGRGHVDRQEAVAEIPDLRGNSGHEKERRVGKEVETLR